MRLKRKNIQQGKIKTRKLVQGRANNLKMKKTAAVTLKIVQVNLKSKRDQIWHLISIQRAGQLKEDR